MTGEKDASEQIRRLTKRLIEVGRKATTTAVAFPAAVFAAVKLARHTRRDKGAAGTEYDVLWKGLSIMPEMAGEAPPRASARSAWQTCPPSEAFHGEDVEKFVETLLREVRRQATEPTVAIIALLELACLLQPPNSGGAYVAIDYLSTHPEFELAMHPTTGDEMEAITAQVTKVVRCSCDKRIYMDDAALTLRHEGEPCEAFLDVLERNASGAPHVADPQTVSSSQEEGEAKIILAKSDARQKREMLDIARSFGLETTDLGRATVLVLREMRARGWHLSFPS